MQKGDLKPSDVVRRLSQITPILAKVAMGDFTQDIGVPQKEDILTEHLVALGLMIDDLKEAYEAHWKIQRMLSEKIEERTKALRKSKELLNKTFQGLDDAIFILDIGKPPRIINCNSAAIKIFGYPRKEMVGRTTEFLHRDKKALELFEQALYPAIETRGALVDFRHTMKRQDGNIFVTEHSVFPLKGGRGEQIGWVNVVEDVSEREKARLALEESEEKFRAITEAAGEAIIILDQKGKIILWNAAAERMFGHRFSEVRDQDLYTLISPVEKQAQAKKDIFGFARSVQSAAENIRFESEVHNKERQKIFAEFSISHLRLGEKRYAIVVVRDITQRKRAEKERRSYTVRLERMNRLMVGRELKMIELKKKIKALERGAFGTQYPILPLKKDSS